MEKTYQKLLNAVVGIRKITDFEPRVALVLGSGLGDYAENIQVVAEVPYGNIPDFPVSTVPGHEGRLVFGYVGAVPVVCMQGRVHYYEGYSIQDVVLPVRLTKMLGADILFLTNASGGIREDLSAGDLMLITDHIAAFAPNPLIGENIEELGTRFPDMTAVYDKELQEIIKTVAVHEGIPLKSGVYAQLTGPSFETPAEIRMLRTLGVDAVGMSTAVEAIAARHAGMRVCGISCIANKAAGMALTPLTHGEVQAAASKAAPHFQKTVTEAIKRF